MDGRLASVQKLNPEVQKTNDEMTQKEKPTPEKEDKQKEDETPTLPGLFDEKLKDFEKQAELVLQRNKEIER